MSLGMDKLTAEDRVVLAQSSGLMSIFEDPISFEIMDKAMMTTCGHSFSEDTINNWILKKNQCPLCNKTLKKSDVSPNYALRSAIARFLTAQAHLQQNIQNSLGNVSVSSSEWTTPASPIADEWKTEDGVSTNLDFKLLVEVISARDLKTDWFGKTNPYCVLEFQDQRRKTTVVHRNRCPAWGEVFVFNVMNINADSNILISVWDKDRILKDSFIGMITVSMAEVITALKMVRRFVLQKKRPLSRKKICGDILLRLQFLDLRANYEIGRSTQPFSPLPSRVATSPNLSHSTPVHVSPPSHHSLPHITLPSPVPYAPPSPAHLSLPHPVPPPLPSILKRTPLHQRRPTGYPGSPASPAPAPAESPRNAARRRSPRDSLGLNRYGIRESHDFASASASGPSNAMAQERNAVASGSGGASASGSGFRIRAAESEVNDSDADSDIVVAGSAASGSAGGSVIVNVSESVAVINEDDDEEEEENEDDQENEANNADNEEEEREEEREEEDEDEDEAEGENNNNNNNNNDDDEEDNGNNNLENNNNNNDNNNNNFNGDINNNNNDNEYDNNNQEHADGENYGNYENYERFENIENVDLDIDIHVDEMNNNSSSPSPSHPSSSHPHSSSSHAPSSSSSSSSSHAPSSSSSHPHSSSSHAPSSTSSSSSHAQSPSSRSNYSSDAYFSDDWALPPPPPPPVDISSDSPVSSIPNSPVKSAKDGLRSTPYFFSTDARRYSPTESLSPPPPPPPLPPRHLTHNNDTFFTHFMSSDEHTYTSVPSPLSPSPAPLSPHLPATQSSSPHSLPRRLDNDFAFTSVGLSPSALKEKSPQQVRHVFPPLDVLDMEAFISNQSSSDAKLMKRDSAEIAQQMYEELHALQFQLQQKESVPASPTSTPADLDELEDEEDEPEEELMRERHCRNNKPISKTSSPSLRLPPSPLSLPLSPSLSLSNPPLYNAALPPSSPVAPARANAVPAKLNTAPLSAQPPPASPSARASNNARRNSASPQASPRTSAHSSAHSSGQSTPNSSRNNSITNASLKNNRGNRTHAAALVLDPQDPVPESPIPLPIARNPAVEARVVANEESVNSLMEMGFERDLAEYALKSCNNEMEPALDKLLNNSGQLQFELLRSLLFTS